MNVQPVVLRGRRVTLEPLAPRHFDDLLRLTEPEVFTYFGGGAPLSSAPEDMRAYLEHRMARTDCVAFAMVLTETDEAVGSTTYMDIRPEDRGLEIGSTWITRPYQGTFVNPENKYLLLRHAFETLGAMRVQLKTDARNLHSQRAIGKLGARHEGVLRKHMLLPGGLTRDTVMFSIIDEEWPEVKRRLEERLGYVP